MTVRSVSCRGLTGHCGLLPLPSIRRGDQNLSSQGRRPVQSWKRHFQVPCALPLSKTEKLCLSICIHSDMQTFLYPGIHGQLATPFSLRFPTLGSHQWSFRFVFAKTFFGIRFAEIRTQKHVRIDLKINWGWWLCLQCWQRGKWITELEPSLDRIPGQPRHVVRPHLRKQQKSGVLKLSGGDPEPLVIPPSLPDVEITDSCQRVLFILF